MPILTGEKKQKYDEMLEQVKKRYLQDVPIKEIMDKIPGCNTYTILKMKKKYGIKRHHSKKTEFNRLALYSDLKNGGKITAMMKKYHISYPVIIKFMEDKGLREPKKDINKIKDDAIMADIQAGLYINQLIRKHKIGHARIKRIADANNLTISEKKKEKKIVNLPDDDDFKTGIEIDGLYCGK